MKKPLVVAILIAAAFISGLVSGKNKAYAYVDEDQLILVGTTISIKE